jgi:hypothetical protein
MNANGTTATDGASFGRRRLAPLSLRCAAWFSVSFLAAATLATASCSRGSGTQANNEQAQAPALDGTLLRAVGKAIQPCIRAHQTPQASMYTAMLRLDRRPSGTAAATFLDGRSGGHEAFESCAVKAIDGAAIAIATTTTMPVGFDFGPER